MNKEHNKPSIRFKGFKDSWIKCEVKEIFSNILSGNRLPKNDLYDGEIPYIIAKVTNNGIHMFISSTTLDYHNNEMKLFPAPSITFSIDNPNAIFVQNESFFTSNIMRVLHNPSLNLNQYIFLAEQLKKLTTYFDWSLKFSGPVVHNSLISLPSENKQINFNEVDEIGRLILSINDLITLHQRKYEKLQHIKKALLEKMFPKVGASIPEIRFKGFTDAWEQRELLKVANYRNGKAHESEIDETGKYIVINSKFVSTNGEIKKYTNNLIEPLRKGELAFVLSDVPNGKAIARTFLINESHRYSLNQRIAGITPLEFTHSYFLNILMNRNKYFLSFDDGAKQTNLSKNDVEQFESLYPIYQEQEKIGEVFRYIDTLITLHQRKYEKLQHIKKALLQNMFV